MDGELNVHNSNMQAKGYEAKLVPLPPLLSGVRPGQFLKVSRLINNCGVYSLSLKPIEEVPNDDDEASLVVMEAEGWITCLNSKYLGIRLPFHLISDDDTFSLCPLRIVEANTLACLTEAEFSFLKLNAKCETSCDGVESALLA